MTVLDPKDGQVCSCCDDGRMRRSLHPSTAPAASEGPATEDEEHLHRAQNKQKELHVAPMMDVSYSEFRYLIRLLTKRTVLWTEMVVDETLVHSPSPEPHLAIRNNVEHPVVCQLGGNGKHLEWTQEAVRLVCEYGYDEVNLNAGCPSNRVAGKEFGAVLMKNVHCAVGMLQTMNQAVTAAAGREATTPIPVSIKTRIAVDNEEGWDTYLLPFITRLVQEGGCRRFFIHARKVYTKGISPAQNRSIPPLDYPSVYRLCRAFPECEFWLNGGIQTLEQAKTICYGTQSASSYCPDESPLKEEEQQHGSIPCLQCRAPNGSCVAPPHPTAPVNLRGCMMGRAVMDNPPIMATVDSFFYGEPTNPSPNRRHVLQRYCEYLDERHPRQCGSGGDDHDDSSYCTVCGRPPANMDCAFHEKESNIDVVVATRTDSSCRTRHGDDSLPNHRQIKKNKKKIPSFVIDRSFKPVLGMFHGLPGTKKWRRALNDWSRDARARNCGPAFLLRQAIHCMPEELLDLPFDNNETGIQNANGL